MAVIVYPALVSYGGDGVLRGRFPDFAALEFVAASQVELLGALREGLAGELQRLEREGEVWPTPSAIQDITAPGTGSVVLIDVSVDDTPIRLTISLGERLLRRIDADAEARSMTRSGYLALGARRLLSETSQPFGGVAGAAGERLQEEVAALGRRFNDTLGPQSPVGRTLAELDAIALDGLRRLGGEVRSAMGQRRRNGAEPSEPDQATDDPGVPPGS